MAALTIAVNGTPVDVRLGENTEQAQVAREGAETALATALALVEGLEPYGTILADSTGTRETTIGFDGDFLSIDYNDYTGEFPAGGPKTYYFRPVPGPGQPLELTIHAYDGVLGTGEITLLVLSGTFPTLTVEQALPLELPADGFSSLDISALDPVEDGQHYAVAVPSGGPGLLFLADASNDLSLKTPDGFADSGAITFATSGGQFVADYSLAARIRQEVPALSIENVATGDTTGKALSYLLPDELPTQWDMFLVAGQSNAQGEGGGYNPLSLPAGIAKQWYSGALTDVTADPVGNANGNSAWISFAQRYFAMTGRGVIFVPAAVGGSGLVVDITFGNWSPSGALRAAAVALVNAAKAAATTAGLRHKLAGVLWWQGEAEGIQYDASGTMIGGGAVTSAAYVTALDALHSYFQTQFASPTLPLVLARIGIKSAGSSAGFTTIQGALDTAVRNNADMHMAFIAPQASVTNYHYPAEVYNRAGREFATVAAAVCVGRA